MGALRHGGKVLSYLVISKINTMLFKNENQIAEFQKLLFANPFTPAMEEIKENYLMGFISKHECLCQLLDIFLNTYNGLTLEELAEKLPINVFSKVYSIFESLKLNEVYTI